MSLSQIWVVAGGDGVRALQTVESGWQVMNLWQTPFATVFVFSSSDNYGSKSCYATKCGTYQPSVQETFVLKTNKIVVGKPLGDESLDGGKQAIIDIKWVRKGDTGDWWLQVNGDWTGYYPKSSFNGGPMSSQADYVDFGGETAGLTPSAQMGSGRFAEDGAGHAAFQSQIRYFDLNDKVISPVVSPTTTDAGSYSITVGGGQKEPEPQAGTFIFFGGPGNGHFGTPGPNPIQVNRGSP